MVLKTYVTAGDQVFKSVDGSKTPKEDKKEGKKTLGKALKLPKILKSQPLEEK